MANNIKRGLESLIYSITYDLSSSLNRGVDLGRGCKHFTEECAEKMKSYAESGVFCDRKCEYCEKFKWIIDRAKHYAEKTGLSYQQVLESWENDRDYWYMNYYQDCMQPELNDTCKIFKNVDEFKKSVGDNGFRCPVCKGISTDPCKCNSGKEKQNGKKCDWKSYGLLRGLNCVHLYFIEERKNAEIFMPIAWEKKEIYNERN